MLVFSEVLKTPSDGDVLVDYSKNLINDEVMRLLFDLVGSEALQISQS